MRRRATTALLTLTGAALVACSVPPPGAGDATAKDLTRVSVSPVPPTYVPPKTCKGYVALSFDDGPTDSSIQLVESLKANNIPATFFNTGEHTRANPLAIAAEKKLPHVEIGNHTWDHPDLSTMPEAKVRKQIEDTKRVQGEDVSLFRPPYGSADATVLTVMRSLGMREVLWTKDSKDYETTDVNKIVAQSMGMTDGGILLLHDGHLPTIQATPKIANAYAKLGLCLGRIEFTPIPQAPIESPALTFFFKAVRP